MTENMIKTTKKKCKKCKYSSGTYDGYPICNYYLDTGKRRECPIGLCDKFEKGKRNPNRDKFTIGPEITSYQNLIL